MGDFIKQLFCFHEFSRGMKVVHDKNNKKRHAYICYKCGKRKYID